MALTEAACVAITVPKTCKYYISMFLNMMLNRLDSTYTIVQHTVLLHNCSAFYFVVSILFCHTWSKQIILFVDIQHTLCSKREIITSLLTTKGNVCLTVFKMIKNHQNLNQIQFVCKQSQFKTFHKFWHCILFVLLGTYHLTKLKYSLCCNTFIPHFQVSGTSTASFKKTIFTVQFDWIFSKRSKYFKHNDI